VNLRAVRVPIPTERTLWIVGALGAWFVLAFVAPWLLWVGIALDVTLVALVVVDAQLAARRRVVVRRDVPPVVHQGHVLDVRWGIVASHTGVLRLRDPLHPALSEQAAVHELRVVPDEQAWLRTSLVPRYRGAAALAPLSIRVQGPLGLAWAEQTFALADTVNVFPKTQLEPDATVVLRRILSRRTGSNAIRVKGMADELYALRTYLPGDAMRTIHWKASARLNRPVTRESQLDQHQRTVVLVDCGRPMSTLSGAMTKLDHTLSAVLALLRAVVASEDTATLVLFSKEVRVVLTVDRHQKSFRPVFERIYAEAADADEADYRAVANWAARHVRERALVVLCTSVIDPIGAERVKEAVTILARRHRPLLVDLQDPSLHRIARSVPADAPSAYAKVSAMGLVHANGGLARTLRAHGVDVLSVPASKLAVSLLQHYLDVKARRQV
jgi:uncharacterized protein (DUF58 family)